MKTEIFTKDEKFEITGLHLNFLKKWSRQTRPLHLACFKKYPAKRLAMKEVLNLTDLPRRTAIDATNTLIKKNFLQKYGRGPATNYQLIF